MHQNTRHCQLGSITGSAESVTGLITDYISNITGLQINKLQTLTESVCSCAWGSLREEMVGRTWVATVSCGASCVVLCARAMTWRWWDVSESRWEQTGHTRTPVSDTSGCLSCQEMREWLSVFVRMYTYWSCIVFLCVCVCVEVQGAGAFYSLIRLKCESVNTVINSLLFQ